MYYNSAKNDDNGSGQYLGYIFVCFFQVQGTMPTVSIDKTDGCMIYLSKDSLNCEIITSKSSEMNILVPKDDGDFVSWHF